MSSAMTASEREAFFAGAHVGVLAVDRDGRGPLAVPIWYGYRPGSDVAVWTGQGSLKDRLIRAAGRFSICAQDETPPYRYVMAEGPVVAVDDDPPAEDAAVIVRRYLSGAAAEDFVANNHANHVIIRMHPDRWLSTDYRKA